MYNYNFDILSALHERAARAVETKEDKLLLKELWAIVCIDNLAKTLMNIPNTKWKKFKYYVNVLFRRLR